VVSGICYTKLQAMYRFRVTLRTGWTRKASLEMHELLEGFSVNDLQKSAISICITDHSDISAFISISKFCISAQCRQALEISPPI
jgi:hypothetical protein